MALGKPGRRVGVGPRAGPRNVTAVRPWEVAKVGPHPGALLRCAFLLWGRRGLGAHGDVHRHSPSSPHPRSRWVISSPHSLGHPSAALGGGSPGWGLAWVYLAPVGRNSPARPPWGSVTHWKDSELAEAAALGAVVSPWGRRQAQVHAQAEPVNTHTQPRGAWPGELDPPGTDV